MKILITIRAVFRLFLFMIAGIILLIFDLLILSIYPFSKKACRKVSLFFGPFWGTVFVKILGIRILVEGQEQYKKQDCYCIISNHMSYLDILVAGSYFPVLFVSRHDVKSWPLLGTIAWVRGSIFVDRTITGARERPYVKQVVDYLKQGFNVIIFPEGTTSDGSAVLPFKKTVFSCPTRAGVPILPITIQYTHIDHIPFSTLTRDQVCWYGNMTFLDHFWGILKLGRIDVSITIHPPVYEKEQKDWLTQNRRLSKEIHDIIAAAYSGLDDT